MRSWCRGGQAHRVPPAPRGQPSPSAAPTHCAAVTSMMAAHGTEPGAVIQSHQRCSPCSLKGRSCAVNRCWGSRGKCHPLQHSPQALHSTQDPAAIPFPRTSLRLTASAGIPPAAPTSTAQQAQHSGFILQPPCTPQLTGTPCCHGIHISHTKTPARGELSFQHLFLGYHTKHAEHCCQ